MNDKLNMPMRPVDANVANIEVQKFAGMTFKDYGQAIDFCRLISQARSGIPGFLRGNPADCLVVTTQAMRWRLDPTWTMQHAYVTKDGALLSYDSAVHSAILLASGKLAGRPRYTYTGKGEERQCKVIAAIVGETEPFEYETPPIKTCRPPRNDKGQVMGSPLWDKDPDQQLGYYAVRNWGRRHMPELMGGVYDRDEIESVQDSTSILAPMPSQHHPDNARTRLKLSPGVNHMKEPEPAPAVTPEAQEPAPEEYDQDTGELLGPAPQPHPFPEVAKILADAARQGTDSLRTAYRNLDADERKHFTQEVITRDYLPAARAADERADKESA